jgi:[acyl-carrier-protein] S-malonyltransferase
LQSVVSGTNKSLLKLKVRLEVLKGHVTILNINTPSHCPLMSTALQGFKEALAHCSFKQPGFKVVSNLFATPYTGTESIANTLLDHMIRPVRWYESIRYLTENGVKNMIDVGPQAMLSQLNHFIDPGISNFELETSGGYNAINDAVTGSRASFIKKCMVMTISSRNYNDNRQEYHEGVEVSYKKLRELAGQGVIQNSDLETSFTLLKKILATKKVPADHAQNILSYMKELL